MEEKQEYTWCQDTLSEIENQVKIITKEGIQPSTVDYLYKLVDIHKDLSNEKYWKEKIDMRYRYGNHGAYEEGSYGRRRRDSRGRYMEGNYGHQQKEEEMMDEMYRGYRDYSYGREQGGNSYGAKEDMKQSLKYMLKSTEDFMAMLMDNAGSEEEVELIKKSAKKISEM